MKRLFTDNSRLWAALSVLMIGEFGALWLLGGDLRLWIQLVLKLIKTSLPGMLGTFGLLVTAVLVSRSMAGALMFLLSLLGGVFQRTVFWLGRALTFFPVHALGWAFVGLWIGRLGFPIWSLMPVFESSESLPPLESLARLIWAWAPALFLLSVPLVGQWLVILAQVPVEIEVVEATQEEREKSLATPHLDSPERVPGKTFQGFILRTRDQIQLPAAVRSYVKTSQLSVMSNSLWNIGMLALILLINIEDILGLPGAACKLALALKSGDLQSAALPVLMLSGVAALATLCFGSPIFRLPATFRQALSWALCGLAWLVAIGSLIMVTLRVTPAWLPSVDSASAFSDPASALWTGLPYMLCALSLWLIGHMMESSKDSLHHA